MRKIIMWANVSALANMQGVSEEEILKNPCIEALGCGLCAVWNESVEIPTTKVADSIPGDGHDEFS